MTKIKKYEKTSQLWAEIRHQYSARFSKDAEYAEFKRWVGRCVQEFDREKLVCGRRFLHSRFVDAGYSPMECVVTSINYAHVRFRAVVEEESGLEYAVDRHYFPVIAFGSWVEDK